MRSKVFVGVVCGVLAVSNYAGAVEYPVSGRRDSRVKSLAYDPINVVSIVGVMRSVSEVTFAPTETITRVAIGDSIAWEVVPADNILFLKPRVPNPPTNMVVVTKRSDGSFRSYNFQLSIRGGEDSDMSARRRDVYFSVVFRYPADEAAERAKVAEAEGTEAQRAFARDRLSESGLQGLINYSYTAEGSSELEPSAVFDNGQVTTLIFPQNQAIPAIFTVLPDKSESRIDYTVGEHGEVSVHGIAKELRLRRGAATTSIYNRAYSFFGVNPGTGTTSSDVVRRVTPESVGVVPSQGPASLTPRPIAVPDGPQELRIPLSTFLPSPAGAGAGSAAPGAGPLDLSAGSTGAGAPSSSTSGR